MKDSGVEWIGEIPEEWDVRKIKHICKVKGVVDHPDEEVLSLYRDIGVVIKSTRDDNFNRTSENTDNYKFVEINDLVVNKMKAWQGSIAVSQYQGIVSPAYYVLTFYENCVFPFFIHYLLRSVVYHPEYRRLSGGIRPNQWDLSIDNFRLIPIILPPLSIQESIASYLDIKSSLIDTTIQKEREIIEKLKEYRQAVITEAVTKGIRPGVPMKDSGVKWIGEIPEGWEICKIKYLARMQSGDTISSEIINDEGEYPVYGGNGLRGYTASFTHSGSYILIGRQGALCGNVHVVNGNFWPSEHAIVVYELGKSNQKWLAYILFSMNLNQYSTSAAQPGLAKEKIRDLFVCLPPIPEQQEIASFLDAKCSAIDATIQKRELAIEKLTAYKQSLIYECVTGKKVLV